MKPLRSTRYLLLAALLTAPSRGDVFVEAHKLLQHARASSRMGNHDQAIRKTAEAADLIERELRSAHPESSERFMKMARTYGALNTKLFQAYRSMGRGSEAKARVDQVLDTLEGLIAQAHSYGTDLFEELARQYHVLIHMAAAGAKHRGKTERALELADRFLGTLEELLGQTHSGNEQWFPPILKTYGETIKKLGGFYHKAGRHGELLVTIDRADRTLTDALGDEHEAVQRVRAVRREVARN